MNKETSNILTRIILSVFISITISTIAMAYPSGAPDTKSTNTGMVVSPNPSHGLFTIRASGLDNINATVTISDITGRTIFQRILPASEIGQEKFDLTGHPKGIYLVRIQTNTESMVRKLIVE